MLGEIVWARCVLQHSILLATRTTVLWLWNSARFTRSVRAEELVCRGETCEEGTGNVFGASSVKMWIRKKGFFHRG